jgi:teichuronic acid biosynthesis protein TuaE
MNTELAIPGARARLTRAWLGRRWPTLLLSIVLASFAVGPQWLLTRELPYNLLVFAIPAQQALLLAALACNAFRFGIRPGVVGWPLLAVLLLLLQSVTAADLDPRLTVTRMMIAAFGLALPWSLPELAVESGMRARYALLIALLPSLCAGVGLVLQAAGLHLALAGSATRVFRLHGASNAGWLVCLAFVGFAVALHEAIRGGRLGFSALAAVNVAIAVMTGGRMGLGAGVVFAVTYCLLDRGIRQRLARVPRPIIGFGLTAALLLFGWLLVHTYHEPEAMLTMSGRDTIWTRYVQEFSGSPTFGRGLGATALVSAYFGLPHNDYLRLLVEGGMVGFLVYAGAIVLWGRRMVARIDPGERAFAQAIFLALAVYALTDNLLTMPPTLMAFFYLGLMLGEPYGRARAGGGHEPVSGVPPATDRSGPRPPRSTEARARSPGVRT